ncbi:NADH-quinone oxidoreductase subunit G [Marmoricola endophyticus]|uniref:NADH-quinone oxidoreductase n=1 Tax=Marmoricola endophyticus TaxID=2040280 RepID=A0A917BNM6_9ACTN|nr:NADH-quinone oxidoreductase subunit G [Marmoricola endophyticus]GGF50985.1 NADH-quinone oxidoreductase subunit G [Marmoricola endophyticus]
MTATADTQAEVEKSDLVTLTIDGIEVSVPEGTLVIRAAEQVGVQIPRFCDHPLLDPVGACRQCLVDVPDAGNGRGMPKPQASCTLTVAPGMVVNTQATSPVAEKAQQGVMELLLINHPLDCPVCDKGGECPLQNQAMSNGRGETRFEVAKRTYPKPINISAQVLLDRERCVLCARCTRFSEQVAGDPFIALIERGALQQVGIYENEPFESYFSGNTIQICPVGALTSASYRFRSRPFDLVSTPGVAEHDACGAAIRVDHRRGKVMRRLAGNDPEVNEEWITDKDRFAFRAARLEDRLEHPMVRDDETGSLRVASWPEALAVAARGLAAARATGVGVLPGGRLTVEDAWAYSKFARVALSTNDVDFRARAHSAEEADFLASDVVGTEDVTYADLDAASVVVLAGLEPEDEAGTLFLRLRKAARKSGTSVYAIAPYTTRGLRKVHGTLLPTAPGAEAEALAGLSWDGVVPVDERTVVLVGERLASVPGALSVAAKLARSHGAKLAWVPRRAGDRGAVESGLLPGLLPGGRPVTDATARVDLAAAWGAQSLPTEPGRDVAGILGAAAAGALGALVVGGVEVADLPDPVAAREALDAVGFLVSLELRASEVTERADVVLPVAPTTDKAGSYLNWEGRLRPFGRIMHVPASLPDLRVLAGIAEEMGAPLGFRTPEQVQDEIASVGAWDGERPASPSVEPGGLDVLPRRARSGSTTSESSTTEVVEQRAQASASRPGEPTGDGGLLLASWKQLLDDGRMQDGDEHLRATARRPVVLAPAGLLDELGLAAGDTAELSGPLGSLVLPVDVADLPDGVVWAPASAPGASVRTLVGPAGSAVTLSPTGGVA